jgi:hypothetical protein
METTKKAQSRNYKINYLCDQRRHGGRHSYENTGGAGVGMCSGLKMMEVHLLNFRTILASGRVPRRSFQAPPFA